MPGRTHGCGRQVSERRKPRRLSWELAGLSLVYF